jgi:uncharacterized protein
VLIAVIADTHLSQGQQLPAGCIQYLRNCDLVVHAGDISCDSVLSGIELIGPSVVAVSGNQDSYELRQKLPTEATIDSEGARIGVVHDAGPKRGRISRLRRRFSDADAVVFGHSHIPLCDAEEGFQIFNPGSPTVRRRALHHTMGLCLCEGGRVTFSHVCLD